jgi:hypothetical protein
MAEEPTLFVGWGEDRETGLAALAKDRPGSWHEFTGGGLPCPVRLRVDLDANGKPVCTGLLLVGIGEVTTQTLRAVPLRRLMTYLAATVSSGHRVKDGEVEFDEATGAIVAELIALGANTERVDQPRTRRGRPPLTDEALTRFAAKYDAARRNPETADAPVRAVAKDWPMSRAAAHRWLRTARERGIIREQASR